MAYTTIAGFETARPGTYERGNRERARQDGLIVSAGGVVNYLYGAKPRLTAAGKPCTIGHGHQPTPPQNDVRTGA